MGSFLIKNLHPASTYALINRSCEWFHMLPIESLETGASEIKNSVNPGALRNAVRMDVFSSPSRGWTLKLQCSHAGKLL
jgi:hypothetical protein